MNSILRAQREAYGAPEPPEAPPLGDSQLPPATPPSSPVLKTGRLTRVASRSNHRAIDIAPLTYENPCQPCRPRLSTPRNPRSPTFFSRVRAVAPYLSLSCFVMILMWELYSLHTEVYRLRVAESSNHSGGGRHASSSSASDLRRMQGSLRDAGGLAPYFLGSTTAPSRGSRDGIRPAQPRGFESTAPGTLAGALGMGALGAGYGAGALGLAAGAGDGFDPPGVGSGGGGLGVGSWRSETERKLAELMATRDLLRQAERGRRAPRPDAAPIPEYMQ